MVGTHIFFWFLVAGDQQSAQLERKLQSSGDLPFLQRAFSQFSASRSGVSQQSIPISTLEVAHVLDHGVFTSPRAFFS